MDKKKTKTTTKVIAKTKKAIVAPVTSSDKKTKQQLTQEANLIFSKYNLKKLAPADLVRISLEFQEKGWHVLPANSIHEQGLCIFTYSSTGEEVAFNPLRKA